MRKLLIVLTIVIFLAPLASAQKVNFGFDKAVDFSKFHTYSYPPLKDPDNNGLKAELMKGEIDHHLKSKGLQRVDSDGDLLIVGEVTVGADVGGRQGSAILPWYSTAYVDEGLTWVGWRPAPGAMVRTGNLALDFFEVATRKKVWSGTVAQKLDDGGASKNIKRVEAAITKLLEKYPPVKPKK